LCRDSEGEGSALNGWDGLTWLPKDLLSVFCGGMAAGDCPCDAANESSAQGVRYIDDFCIGNNCGIESKRGGGDLLTIAGHAGIGRLCGTHPEGVCKFWSFVSGPTFPSLFFCAAENNDGNYDKQKCKTNAAHNNAAIFIAFFAKPDAGGLHVSRRGKSVIILKC